jgi:hypothetical protein
MVEVGEGLFLEEGLFFEEISKTGQRPVFPQEFISPVLGVRD